MANGEFGYYKHTEMSVIRNVWGTDKALINADEFCVECEHAIGGHYINCPTRNQVEQIEKLLESNPWGQAK